MSHLPLSAIDKHIAKRLEVRRKLLGIPAEKIAFAIAHSTVDYLRYEAAEERVEPSLLDELAALLSVPPSYFLMGGKRNKG